MALGKANLMADQNVDTGSLAAKADELRGSSATALFVAVGGKPGGIIAIADPIKAMTMMRNIRQNLFFSFIYNALGIPIAAGVLYQIFGILLSPIITGAALIYTYVSMIANACRMRSVRLSPIRQFTAVSHPIRS